MPEGRPQIDFGSQEYQQSVRFYVANLRAQDVGQTIGTLGKLYFQMVEGGYGISVAQRHVLGVVKELLRGWEDEHGRAQLQAFKVRLADNKLERPAPGPAEALACELCGQTFEDRAAYVEHAHGHMRQVGGACGVCGAAFHGL